MAEEEAISNIGFVQNPNIIEGLSTLDNNNPPLKKKRNLPGTPDPEAEVIALSPKTLMATNRFLCEICGKGFQRDQNLQLHRRGHNLPWKLKQRSSKEPKKRVYVCPEKTCVHHHPSRALGDLTGIKKHFCRKHGEKKWKCDKCSKRYAVQSDWKAHSKTCGTREYKCDCGTLFSRRDSFITHRAFCDALAEETARVKAETDHMNNPLMAAGNMSYHFMGASVLGPNMTQHFPSIFKPISANVDDTTIGGGGTTRGLSLWMGQGISQLGQDQTIGHNNNNNNVTTTTSALQEIHQIFGDHHLPLVSCSNPPPSDYHQQLNWVLGSNNNNKLSSNSSTITTNEELTTTSLPLRNSNNVKEATASNNQLVSVPSLYSTQHTSPHQTPSSANMSATALLQKAAQIGATSTESSFLGSFGLKCRNNNNQVQDGNTKSCGLYGSNHISSTAAGHGINGTNNVDNQEGDHLLQIYPAAKRRHVQGSEEGAAAVGGGGGGGGQTRDFLGVGVQAICHPSSINGWI